MVSFQKRVAGFSPRWRYGLGAGLVLLGAAGFSAKAVLIRLAYQTYPIDSLTLLALRMLFSVPFYVFIAARLSRQPGYERLRLGQLLPIIGLGLTGYYAASLLDFMGLQYITASVERLILFVYPTIVLLVSALFFGKRIHRVQVVALMLTYVGIALAFLDDIDPHLQTNLPLGAALIFGSAFAYALYLVGTGEIIPRVGSGRFTCYAMLAAAGGTFLHFLTTRPVSLLTHLPGSVYALGGWIAIISTVLPTFLTAEGIRLIGSGNTSIVGSAGPIITIGLAYLLLGETVGVWQGLGTLLVLAGVLLISLKGKK